MPAGLAVRIESPTEGAPGGPRPPSRRRTERHSPGRIPAPTLLLLGAGERRRRALALPISLSLHVLVLGALVIGPLLLPDALPGQQVPIVAFLHYDPPPPPPPPLPLGSQTAPERFEPPRPVTPEPARDTPPLTAPIEVPDPESVTPDAGVRESQQAGSPGGSLFGVPEGMEGGVPGGEVGGVPGGVLGGVVGGTGTGPAPPTSDFDRPPVPLYTPKPAYPHDAFVKKVEGTVVLQIVIDAQGNVAWMKVIESIPLLDAAALDAVRQWRFRPALKHGRRVASLAQAPVYFRIY